MHDKNGILQRFLSRRDPVALTIAFTPLLVRGVSLIKMHMSINKGRTSHHSGGVQSFGAGRSLDVTSNFLVFSIVTNENINDFTSTVEISIFNKQHSVYLQDLICSIFMIYSRESPFCDSTISYYRDFVKAALCHFYKKI